MYHLLGQWASSPRKTSSTGFLFLLFGLLGWGKRLSLGLDPPLPSLRFSHSGSDQSRRLERGQVGGPWSSGAWMRCAARRRARGGRGTARWPAPRSLREGTAPDAAPSLKVPCGHGPDDWTTARCGRHKACESARQEREQSWFSPVSSLRRGHVRGGRPRAAQTQTSLPRDECGWKRFSGTLYGAVLCPELFPWRPISRSLPGSLFYICIVAFSRWGCEIFDPKA